MELVDGRRVVVELIRLVENRYGIAGAAEAGISTELFQAYVALRRAETAADKLERRSDMESLTRPEAFADSPDLASTLTMRQRMAYLLRGGAMTIEALAKEIKAKPETVRRTAYRNKGLFIVMEGRRVGLLDPFAQVLRGRGASRNKLEREREGLAIAA